MRGCGLTKAVGSLIVMCCLLRRNYEWRVHALSQFTCMGGFIGADRPRKRQRNVLGDVSGGGHAHVPFTQTVSPAAGRPIAMGGRFMRYVRNQAHNSPGTGGRAFSRFGHGTIWTL